MKKQFIILLFGIAFNSAAFAQDIISPGNTKNTVLEDQSPVNVKGSGAAMEQGFNSWGKSEVTTGGPGGQVLEGEVKAWDKTYDKINNKPAK
ncbi:hypothetical protein [Thiomicrorhabdus sp.]|uniref:hypothetical protein n=1 Tax=Thiomicrorhabdus sp. TaxID=2039724 RepID=UPI002AA77549|nr:hypothetical protein [Thiomicrorhabdus sp.]